MELYGLNRMVLKGLTLSLGCMYWRSVNEPWLGETVTELDLHDYALMSFKTQQT